MDMIKRNVKIDVNIDRDIHRKLINQIHMYRAACRKAYSACAMAEMAGADIEIHPEKGLRVMPKSKEAKGILEAAFGNPGKSLFYEIRQWARSLCPSWKGIMGESIQYNVVSKKWKAPDPEFPKVKNGFMVLNGSRNFARFNRIGIPIKNTEVKFGDRSIVMKWDFDLGPVEFRVAKMDGSRIFKFRNIQSGEWKLGTVYINIDDDGKVFLLVSYSAPNEVESLDPEKTMTISFGDESGMFINCSGAKSFESDVISVFEAVNGLASMRKIGEKYESCKASAGNPRRAWGSKTIYSGVQKKINKLSKRRSNYVKDRNHLWSRRITDDASRWKCGKVVVINIPSKELFGHPWQWFQFSQFLSYKLGEIGSSVEFVTVEKEEEQAA